MAKTKTLNKFFQFIYKITKTSYTPPATDEAPTERLRESAKYYLDGDVFAAFSASTSSTAQPKASGPNRKISLDAQNASRIIDPDGITTGWAFAVSDGFGRQADAADSEQIAADAAAVANSFAQLALLENKSLDGNFVSDLQKNVKGIKEAGLAGCKVTRGSMGDTYSIDGISVGDNIVVIVGQDGQIKHQLPAQQFQQDGTYTPYSTKQIADSKVAKPAEAILSLSNISLAPGEYVLAMTKGVYEALGVEGKDGSIGSGRNSIFVIEKSFPQDRLKAYLSTEDHAQLTARDVMLKISDAVFEKAATEKQRLIQTEAALKNVITAFLIMKTKEANKNFDDLKPSLLKAYTNNFVFDDKKYKEEELGNKTPLQLRALIEQKGIEFNEALKDIYSDASKDQLERMKNQLTEHEKTRLITEGFETEILKNANNPEDLIKNCVHSDHHAIFMPVFYRTITGDTQKSEFLVEELMRAEFEFQDEYNQPSNFQGSPIRTAIEKTYIARLKDNESLSILMATATQCNNHGDDCSLMVFKAPPPSRYENQLITMIEAYSDLGDDSRDPNQFKKYKVQQAEALKRLVMQDPPEAKRILTTWLKTRQIAQTQLLERNEGVTYANIHAIPAILPENNFTELFQSVSMADKQHFFTHENRNLDDILHLDNTHSYQQVIQIERQILITIETAELMHLCKAPMPENIPALETARNRLIELRQTKTFNTHVTNTLLGGTFGRTAAQREIDKRIGSANEAITRARTGPS